MAKSQSFFGVAAQQMGRILVDHARNRHAAKRGGSAPKVTLDEALVVSDQAAEDVLQLNELLSRLGELDEQQARVVELRVFGGLTVEEAAEALGVWPATMKRDWAARRLAFISCSQLRELEEGRFVAHISLEFDDGGKTSRRKSEQVNFAPSLIVIHASPCVLWTQVCFSKSSCATRLNASAATVLSKRGAVIPHVQREQHQPLKSSLSIQIKRFFMHLPLRAFWDSSLGAAGRKTSMHLARKVNSCQPENIFYWNRRETK